MKPILIIATLLTLMLSACAPKAVPTVDPAQVQASAVAAANTMVAMTEGGYSNGDTCAANGYAHRYTTSHTDHSALAHYLSASSFGDAGTCIR